MISMRDPLLDVAQNRPSIHEMFVREYPASVFNNIDGTSGIKAPNE